VSNAARLLIRASADGHFELVVPELVIREVVNKFKETLTEAVAQLRRPGQVFRRLQQADWVLTPSEEDISNRTTVYERHLREHLGPVATIPPLPSVSHDAVVDRALQRIKPFGSSDRGYRDALIWESVIQLAIDVPPVAFVCANTRDFTDGTDKERFAAVLREELAERANDDQAAVLYTSLKAFTDAQVAPADAARNEVLQLLETGAGFREAVENQIRAKAEGEFPEVGDIDFGEELEVEELRIMQVGTIGYISVVNARVLSDDEVLMELEAEADADIDFYAYELRGEPPFVEHGDSVIGTETRTIMLGFEATFVVSESQFRDLRFTRATG
jgi:hypothetical protein